MNSANSAFQVMHVHHIQAVLSAKPGEINYSGALPIGPNEACVPFGHDPFLAVSMRPSAMADNASASNRDHMRRSEPMFAGKLVEIPNCADARAIGPDETVVLLYVVTLTNAVLVRPAFVGLELAAGLIQSHH
jgi:hypothetical protein